MSETVALVLAAGKGTRMRSRIPKVLHGLAGQPMLHYIIDALAELQIQPLIVLGHEAEQVRAILAPTISTVIQHEQRGTGHAVVTALPALPESATRVVILYGDTPLLRAETIRQLLERQATDGVSLALLTTIVDDPTGYGRIIRAPLPASSERQHDCLAIVEQKETTPEQAQIREINCGMYCVDVGWLRAALPLLATHGDGEYYLTDLVALAAAQGRPAQAYIVPDAVEVLGVNDRVQLAEAAAILRRRINEAMMRSGVTLIDPATTYIDKDVVIGEDSIIYPQTTLLAGTIIGAECQIGPGTRMEASRVGDRCRVIASHVENAILEDEVSVGPFAHLRRGAYLESGVEVGNYAEVKNSRLGAGTKMHHCSYVGDATVGTAVNIGAGAITCNYDGVQKHRTVIEDGVFVGCDTMLRAPVHLGAGSRTGAGAVVVRDVPAGETVAGVPARPLTRLPSSEGGEPDQKTGQVQRQIGKESV